MKNIWVSVDLRVKEKLKQFLYLFIDKIAHLFANEIIIILKWKNVYKNIHSSPEEKHIKAIIIISILYNNTTAVAKMRIAERNLR